jgi:hypothetical protein
VGTLEMRTNHSDSPLVTVSLACYAGDVHLLDRAVRSISNQDLDLKQIQVLPIFDGDPTKEEEEQIVAAFEGSEFHSSFLIGTGRKTGYYCLGRNQAIEYPYNFGFYQANLDADNEWESGHLSGLLEAIRLPDPEDGWPHFVYSRRRFVFDEEAEGKDLPEGTSPFREWTEENCQQLLLTPKHNFLDTGDFLIGKGALYELAERTGCIWNTNLRRFGDWDLACRLVRAGIRGRAIDQVTHLYHWTGKNLQTDRKLSEFTAIPEDIYDKLKREGKIRD